MCEDLTRAQGRLNCIKLIVQPTSFKGSLKGKDKRNNESDIYIVTQEDRLFDCFTLI